ncbi:uncharacterized protein Z518_03030 [Rhinocladiella mackenziei CBS 650.93]|uniref:Rhinocladiella mackenziei CBS 650.93 unplaced genomic scaffold supercont1.2, whole genome shotgun sequence n=1 Tax=Rhinocladiella mackenziei CBS 650.93 TaxID=1442369 RepID=A0A0D2IQX3_9EURO|nr:uncharacterized protein Z518_03030 [Rhinocladiella mackenziei CBS 650.93]KIX08374.1 hypothetical protein Z518_03030 [Rhinocladiella mackenziei CBS 650.93]
MVSPPIDIPFVRTPDSRFQNLPDFPYQPQYLQYGHLRMAYIDEWSPSYRGLKAETETFLLLHGEPTWSFLYRKMIPIFLHHTTKSHAQPRCRRVICPDLLGFGRSDKPVRDQDYTFGLHRSSLLHLIQSLDLTNITLVVQDWGGLLGLTLPIVHPSRFKRVLAMNTMLATGGKPTPGFVAWRAWTNKNPDMEVGKLLGRSCPHLSAAERRAYDAPFPGREFKAGVRRFPNMVMVSDGGKEGLELSKASLELFRSGGIFQKPEDVFVVCGMKDPVLGPPVMEEMARIWGNGCVYVEIQDAGHFVQEWGEQVAKMAMVVFDGTEIENVRRIVPGGRL